MLYYRCPECSQESPLSDEQTGKAVKCPHCGMLGMAYGVSVREGPQEPPAVPPPRPEPSAPAEPAPPPEPEPKPSPPPEAPVLEPSPPEPREGTPERQQVPVRRVGPHLEPEPPAKPDSTALLSMWLGLASLLLSCCCPIGAPLAIAAIITGLISLGKTPAPGQVYVGRGAAKAGVVLGVIALVVCVISWLVMMKTRT
ncbi:MAG: hypothetical protein ACYS5V_08940 [Planctomycetota bacterium]